MEPRFLLPCSPFLFHYYAKHLLLFLSGRQSEGSAAVVRAGELHGCEKQSRRLPPQKANEDLVSGTDSWVPREQTVQFDFPCLDEGFRKIFFFCPHVNLLMQWLLFPPRFLWGRGSD